MKFNMNTKVLTVVIKNQANEKKGGQRFSAHHQGGTLE